MSNSGQFDYKPTQTCPKSNMSFIFGSETILRLERPKWLKKERQRQKETKKEREKRKTKKKVSVFSMKRFAKLILTQDVDSEADV